MHSGMALAPGVQFGMMHLALLVSATVPTSTVPLQQNVTHLHHLADAFNDAILNAQSDGTLQALNEKMLTKGCTGASAGGGEDEPVIDTKHMDGLFLIMLVIQCWLCAFAHSWDCRCSTCRAGRS